MNTLRDRDLVCAPWRLAHRFGGVLILPITVDPGSLARHQELHRWEQLYCFVRDEAGELRVGADILTEIRTPRIIQRIVLYEPPSIEETLAAEVLLAILKQTPVDTSRSTLAITLQPSTTGLAVALALASQLIQPKWVGVAVTTLRQSRDLSGGILITHDGILSIFPTT